MSLDCSIKIDENFLIVDSGGDAGDSANRSGLFAMCTDFYMPLDMFFTKNSGELVRHPTQSPWDNPKNFSRDQLIPLVAGLWKREMYSLASSVFWAHARRGFFCQNTERDVPGSKKYPWPHLFFKDSYPNPKTVLASYSLLKGFYFKEINDPEAPKRRLSNHYVTEYKTFDMPDILGPADIWHLILCAKLWPLYWFGVIGYPWLVANIFFHAKFNKSDDEGQIISQCVVAGRPFVWLYRTLKKDYRESLRRYWTERRSARDFEIILVGTVEGRK